MQIKIVSNYLDKRLNSKELFNSYSNYVSELLNDKKKNNDSISFDKKNSILTITCITNECSQKMEFKVDFKIKRGIQYTCPFCNVKLFESKYFMLPTNSIYIPKLEIVIGGVIIQSLSSWLQNLGDKKDICEIVRESDSISFRTYDENKSNYLVYELQFDHASQIVYIPTILVKEKLYHTGTGMKLIRSLFDICKKFNYDLYIVNMVESFYNRMVGRKALQSGLDSVKIMRV